MLEITPEVRQYLVFVKDMETIATYHVKTDKRTQISNLIRDFYYKNYFIDINDPQVNVRILHIRIIRNTSKSVQYIGSVYGTEAGL